MIVGDIEKKGFVTIKAEYFLSENGIESLFEFQSSYNRLERDESHGNRYRRYSKFIYENNTILLTNEQNYMQSKEYNNEDGDKVRYFSPIEKNILNNPLFQTIINKDLEIAKQLDIVNFTTGVNIGVHQVRYCGSKSEPSYSSPLLFHKDDEEIVFIHLLNLTGNAIGGDSLIAYDLKKVSCILRLQNPLETLIVTKKMYHAVTPLGSNSESYAYRDILLVTFNN